MIIYVAHSRDYDFRNELYTPIKAAPFFAQHTFILPHEKSEEPYSSKELLQNKRCDLLIAEVSFPSIGMGIELGWAEAFKVPVGCFYKVGTQVSGQLGKVSDFIVEYTNIPDMVTKMAQFIEQHGA